MTQPKQRALSYSPRWSPHVVGRYDPREVDLETGEADPQVIDLECSKCGDRSRASCNSGNVRAWVNRYGTAHMHKDTMDPARVKEMAKRT